MRPMMATHAALSRRLYRKFRCIKRIGYADGEKPGVVRMAFAFKWYVLFRQRKRKKVWKALDAMRDELPVGITLATVELSIEWFKPSGRGDDDWCLEIYPWKGYS